MQQPVWNFEQEPSREPMDETSVNLRAYFDRMPDEKMTQYSPAWSAEQSRGIHSDSAAWFQAAV